MKKEEFSIVKSISNQFRCLDELIERECVVYEDSHEFILIKVIKSLKMQYGSLLWREEYLGDVFKNNKVRKILGAHEINWCKFSYKYELLRLQFSMDRFFEMRNNE